MCAIRIMKYLEPNNILDGKQYGFRRNRSTVDALHEVICYISESKWMSQYSCLISLDVKNAFNSDRRTELLRLLAEYGVPPELLDLTDSFLWNRTVISNINEHYFNVKVRRRRTFGRFSCWC